MGRESRVDSEVERGPGPALGREGCLGRGVGLRGFQGNLDPAQVGSGWPWGSSGRECPDGQWGCGARDWL